MNQQEAIEKIRDIDVTETSTKIALVSRILSIVEDIEPEKPVIPQFVAEWIEHCKTEGYTMFHSIRISYGKTEEWLSPIDNQSVFALAYGYGYKLEKPKLYTVEIPNPNGIKFCLARGYDGISISKVFGARWRGVSCYQLTEEEIRKDFEWAWQAGFAKPVEVE